MKSTKKKKEEQRRRKRIFLSILMILFVGVILTVSTYAWFTANQTVSVDEIEVNVQASNGLQLSVDAVEWKPKITNQDIIDTIDGTNTNYPTNKNHYPTELDYLAPISTVGDVDPATGFMKMFFGTIGGDEEGDYSLTATAEDESTLGNGNPGHFVAFDLFIQVQQEMDIYLTNQSFVKAGSKSTGIENAARVGFVTSDSLGVGDGSTSLQALLGNESVIWEPNNDVHTSSGVENAKNVYNIITQTTGASPITYYGVKNPITESVKLYDNDFSADADHFGTISGLISTPASGISSDEYKTAFHLQEGVSKVRVYLWVEGQDVDCEDVAAGGSISFNLEFSVLSSATA